MVVAQWEVVPLLIEKVLVSSTRVLYRIACCEVYFNLWGFIS